MKTYAHKLKLDWAALTDTENPTAIAINQLTYQRGHDYKELYLFKNSLKHIKGKLYQDGETTFASITLNIAAATKETPFEVGRKSIYYDQVEFYMTQEAYEGMLKQAGKSEPLYLGMILLNCTDSLATELAIGKLLQKSEYTGLECYIRNISEQVRQNRQMFMAVDIFVFGFVTLIALIGVANIFNTISTNLILRKREFAMLKSVGMSPRSFKKMIRFESLLYGIKTTLYGIPISFIVMIGIYLALSRNFDTIFSIPWVSIIVGIALIFILVSLTMFYASRRLKKDNVIESLRIENI